MKQFRLKLWSNLNCLKSVVKKEKNPFELIKFAKIVMKIVDSFDTLILNLISSENNSF